MITGHLMSAVQCAVLYCKAKLWDALIQHGHAYHLTSDVHLARLVIQGDKKNYSTMDYFYQNKERFY